MILYLIYYARNIKFQAESFITPAAIGSDSQSDGGCGAKLRSVFIIINENGGRHIFVYYAPNFALSIKLASQVPTVNTSETI